MVRSRPGRTHHWLWVGGPVPPGSDAITIGSVVVVRAASADSVTLLRHEQVHVRQWRRYGAVVFLWQYLRGYLYWRLRGYPHEGAYRRIPFEVEAYWLQRGARS